ncbi:hypothetical protein [Propioniciclava sinopodophylli]|uniref:hypothetical protein n=1 Tax=Propioniciclava sinopodophylli TaxID=1837344 RepID=UPI0024905CED|nr:hypothetical protein [Propioniciclava sinopodophylli]
MENLEQISPRTFAQVASPTLHLLDVENMLGGWVSPGRVAEMWHAYATSAPVLLGDHVIAGFGPRTAVAGMFELPHWVRKVVGPNSSDCADIVLIDCVDVHHAAHRYARVIIGSCDGRFAALAWTLRALGARVWFVDTEASSVSWLLQRTCQGHLTVPCPPPARAHAHAS